MKTTETPTTRPTDEPSPAALRVAELIVPSIDSKGRAGKATIPTTWGRKTRLGIAAMIDGELEQERASLAELRAIVAEFLMTHALEPTRTRPVMPMNTPLAQGLLQRARAAVGLTDTDLAIHPEELNHTSPSMRYHDGQPARVGDTFVIGTYGTCRIESLQEKVAITRNILTNERFDLDDLIEADLLDRAEEANHTQAMVQAFGEHGQG